MQALHDERVRCFEAWGSSLELEEEIGRGEYGCVFRAADSFSAAKVVTLQPARRARQRVMQEHKISLLQTLLVLRKVSCFHPLHYGVRYQRDALGRQLACYMERFDGSLEALAETVLRGPQAWKDVLFQALHGALSLANVFQLAHNDLYPRNVLVRKLPAAVSARVGVDAWTYARRLDYLAVVSDYGVASGGASALPDVVHASKRRRLSPLSLLTPLQHHILYYDAELFARDPLALLLACVHADGRTLPSCPMSIRLWITLGLQQILVRMKDFAAPRAQKELFHAMFEGCRRPRGPAAEDGDLTFEVSAETERGAKEAALRVLEARGSLVPQEERAEEEGASRALLQDSL